MFKKIFPSITRGNGRLVKIKTGEGQGIKPRIKMANCKQCGMYVDINSVAHNGGTYNANGGYGAITTYETDYGYYGVREVIKGAGCPNCGSKNILQ